MNSYLTKHKIKIPYTSKVITWKLIHDLLKIAIKNKKEGSFAKYIIGASLQVTFPDITIDNSIFDSLDNPNILFDYHVGDTAFNITTSRVYLACEKCKRNHSCPAR